MLLKKASLCQSVSFVTLVMDLGSIVLMCLLVSASLNVILLCSLCCLLRKPGITRKSENRGEDNSPSPCNVKKYQKHDAKIKQCSKPLLDREDEITIVVKNGKVFHKSTCGHVSKNRAAETKTYTACKACFGG